jgi:DNA-binding CsgD family transcriptional regulator
MELLERSQQLETLSTLLDEAAEGTGRLVLVAGEAGVGKTALCRKFCDSVAERSTAMWGACDPLAAARPLGPLVDISTELGGEIPGLLKEGARDRVFVETLRQLIERSEATIVVFEDVHWADESTLDLLRFLARRIGSAHVLLLVTYRDDQLDQTHPLRVVLGDLASAAAVRRLAIPPLSQAAVRELAADSSLDAGKLHRETGGNPFYVTEVLSGGSKGLPPTVVDAVLGRAARLSLRARRTLDAAAVIGARIEPTLLLDLTGVDSASLDECISSGMLRFDPPAYAFRHELARQAVMGAVSPQRRAALHAEILSLLRKMPVESQQLPRLAEHAEEAGDRQAVLEFAPAAAAAAAALGAHREASAQYARALRFADQLPPEPKAKLLESRSYECYLIGRFDEAVASRREALELWRILANPLKQGENLRWLSRSLWFAGRGAEADHTASEAVEVLKAQPPGAQLAWAYSNLAQQRMLSAESADAISLGEKAVDLAENLGETEILVHVLNTIGTSRLVLEEDGWGELERSLQLALEAGLEDHAARAYVNLYFMGVQHRNWSRVDRYFHEGTAYCSKHDLDAYHLYLLGQRCTHLLSLGLWDESSQLAVNLLAQSNLRAIRRIAPLVVLGTIRARRGEPGAQPLLDEALELAAPTGELQRLAPVRWARSEAAWLVGDHSAGADEARAGLEIGRHVRSGWLVGELALWLWRSGGLDVVPEHIAEPYALEISGDWRAAAAHWQQLGCPYEEALALANSAQEDDLRAALAKLEALGARPAASMVARALREGGAKNLPRGPRPTTRANLFGLTSREVEVLRMLEKGLRNAEIAGRLFVSEKTVDHHVSSILGKLAVQSRGEAVQKARELLASPN